MATYIFNTSITSHYKKMEKKMEKNTINLKFHALPHLWYKDVFSLCRCMQQPEGFEIDPLFRSFIISID